MANQPPKREGARCSTTRPDLLLRGEAGPFGVTHEKDVDGGQAFGPEVSLVEKWPQKVVLEEEQSVTIVEERQTKEPQAKEIQNSNLSIGGGSSAIIFPN
ncbi:hypothetical protein ACH5RR_015812 [Cinchona calisaya]|uniref:Uncharacterized protein n=1 Tax=Cinchona calisaya TaxID=153742 RepID=A0ABD2ZZL9_9GENT